MLFTWWPYRIDSMDVSSQTGEAWAWCFMPILLAGSEGVCARQPALRGEREKGERRKKKKKEGREREKKRKEKKEKSHKESFNIYL